MAKPTKATPPPADPPVSNALKAVSQTETELRVANHLILWGGRDLTAFGHLGNTEPIYKNPDGSAGEFFSKSVDLESPVTQAGKVPVDFDHGRDIFGDQVIGYVDWATKKVDDVGVWVERVLDRRSQYVKWLESLIAEGLIGTSSEADPAMISKKANGEITRWGLKRDSLTVTPMEPRMLSANALQAMKALGMGIPEKAVQPPPDGGQTKPTPIPPQGQQTQPPPAQPQTAPQEPPPSPPIPPETQGIGQFAAFELSGQFYVYETDAQGEAVGQPVAGPYGTAPEAVQAAASQQATEPPNVPDNTVPPVAAPPTKGLSNMPDNSEDITKLTALVADLAGQVKALTEAPRLPTPAGGSEAGQAKEKDERPFKSLAEQCFAVRDFTEGKATEIQVNKLVAVKSLATGIKATGANELVSSEGGAIVQTDFAADIFQRTYETGAITSRTFKQTISNASNGIRIPAVDEQSRADGSRWGGIQAYWGAEAGTITKSKPAWRTIDLELKKLFALVYGTNELLADAPAFDSYLGRVLPLEIMFKLEDAILNGLGGGTPQGIVGAPCTYSVPKETGQGAQTVLFQNIIKMWSHMWAGGQGVSIAEGNGGSMKSAVWLINQNVLPQLYQMSMAVGTGGVPVFMPANGLSGSPYASLLNRPIIPVEQAQTLGTVGDIILADLSQYALAEKGGIQAAQSIHVQFLTDETAFRWTFRTDGKPLWNTGLIPFKGSATTDLQTPFVTLATRA